MAQILPDRILRRFQDGSFQPRSPNRRCRILADSRRQAPREGWPDGTTSLLAYQPLACAEMYRRGDRGWVEVICGPMFSGKSEELIRRVTRYQIARVPVQTFKPRLDVRYADSEVVSHSSLKVDAIPVETASDLLHRVEESTQVIGVDEGQFFDDELVGSVEQLAAAGKQVIVAGLDTDYLRRPFEPIPTLCDRAEYVTKMLAVCHKCGGPGMYTQRIVHSDDLVVLGAQDAYEARCRVCYDPTEPEQPKLDLVAG